MVAVEVCARSAEPAAPRNKTRTAATKKFREKITAATFFMHTIQILKWARHKIAPQEAVRQWSAQLVGEIERYLAIGLSNFAGSSTY